MICLAPGPSQVSELTKKDIQRAIKDGVLEMSHRSRRFTDMSRLCVEELKKYLGIPKGYRVFYMHSATEGWHSIAANTVRKTSFHFVYGSFGAKARDAAKFLGKNALSVEVPWGEVPNFIHTDIPNDTELITVCYNETSTGVKMLPGELSGLRKKHPNTLIAVDTTSCAGGVYMEIADADLWYFSVQKIFGLPPGLGILIVSQRAFERAAELHRVGENLAGIWSWERHDEMMRDEVYQTHHTPNSLAIYLLAKQCERWNKSGGLSKRVQDGLQKKNIYEKWISKSSHWSNFVRDSAHRSDTVFVVQGAPRTIARAKAALLKKGYELGGGYGKIKDETLRIANFPAISAAVLKKALALLETSAAEK